MNERRKFIKGIGLFGAVFAGAATAKVQIDQPKQTEDISHLAPDSTNYNMTLMGNKKKEEQPRQFGQYQIYGVDQFAYQNKVEISVGKDDRLWIKVGENWRRVSID